RRETGGRIILTRLSCLVLIRPLLAEPFEHWSGNPIPSSLWQASAIGGTPCAARIRPEPKEFSKAPARGPVRDESRPAGNVPVGASILPLTGCSVNLLHEKVMPQGRLDSVRWNWPGRSFTCWFSLRRWDCRPGWGGSRARSDSSWG